MGAYATSQHIRTSTLLLPGEQNLTEEAERLAARREIDRLSASKFLQAQSAQLQKLTGLSIQAFQVPQDLEWVDPQNRLLLHIDVYVLRLLINIAKEKNGNMNLSTF